MKRIDVVHAMSDALSQFLPDSELNTRNLIADVLLYEAERMGMVPTSGDSLTFSKLDGTILGEVSESNNWEE